MRSLTTFSAVDYVEKLPFVMLTIQVALNYFEATVVEVHMIHRSLACTTDFCALFHSFSTVFQGSLFKMYLSVIVSPLILIDVFYYI